MTETTQYLSFVRLVCFTECSVLGAHPCCCLWQRLLLFRLSDAPSLASAAWCRLHHLSMGAQAVLPSIIVNCAAVDVAGHVSV